MSSEASAIRGIGISPNESDTNLEPANIVDGLFAIARAIHGLSEAIEAHKAAAPIDPKDIMAKFDAAIEAIRKA